MEILGIEIEVQRKRIKNLHLYVLPPDARVRISVPLGFSDEEIEKFVKSKMNWILKQRIQILNRQNPKKNEYETGDCIYVFGQKYIIQIIHSGRKNSLTLFGDTAVLNTRKNSTKEQREKIIKEWYREALREKVSELLPKWERRTGLYCSGWQSKDMVTRWGTCNTKTKKIWLNLKLAKRPLYCLEYVILHELAHLKVSNHGEKFVAILDKYNPSWKQIRKVMNNHSLDYMD